MLLRLCSRAPLTISRSATSSPSCGFFRAPDTSPPCYVDPPTSKRGDHDSRRRHLHRARRIPDLVTPNPARRDDHQDVGGPHGQQRLPGDLFRDRREPAHRRGQRPGNCSSSWSAEHAPKLALIVTSHQHFDHWQALAAVAEATGAPTAVHQLDAEPLPVKPDRFLAGGDTIACRRSHLRRRPPARPHPRFGRAGLTPDRRTHRDALVHR